MSTRNTKRLSGSHYRKRKLEKEDEKKRLTGSFLKYLKTENAAFDKLDPEKNQDSFSVDPKTLPEENSPLLSTSETVEGDELQEAVTPPVPPHSEDVEDDAPLSETSRCSPLKEIVLESEVTTIDFKDLALWNHPIDSYTRKIIIETGPFQMKDQNFVFPIDDNGRKFGLSYYFRIMNNGEKIKRNWLVYSNKNNSVFCFCCKLFCKDFTKTKLTREGFSDWQHLSLHLNRHEVSRAHFKNFQSWLNFQENIQKNTTIDTTSQKLFEIERTHWRLVIERMIYIIQYLAKQCLPFRGKQSKLFQQNNGNILKLIEMLSKFDPVISEHVRRITISTTKLQKRIPQYVGYKVQNEIIELMADAIKQIVFANIRESKYYSIILDCTPDISKTEQMSLTIRTVSVSRATVQINENFIEFCPVIDTTGKGLAEYIIDKLSKLGLNLKDIRGQGYDNGSNMRGKNSGVQKRILDLNSRAFFVPCSSHSLNLVVNDAAKASNEIIIFFSSVQQLYNFFSSSTYRWSTLKKHISSLTLKPLSDTRWESRVDALRPLYHELDEVYDALEEISNDVSRDTDSRHEAISLAYKIQNYNFICSLVLWYKILVKVNAVSKVLQARQTNLQTALMALEKLKEFVETSRTEESFENILEVACKICEDVGGVCEFTNQSTVRKRKKKRLFDYEGEDEPIVDGKQLFRVNFFNILLDQVTNSIDERFSLLERHHEEFGFLHNLGNLREEELLKHCKDLHLKLTDNDTGESDIDGLQLYEEIKYLQLFGVPEKDVHNILKFIFEKGLDEIVPNLVIALRILLTMPVSVASAERSFSKLKLIKNYLRSTMGQERLSSLAIISIESEIGDAIDFSELVQKFASMKARGAMF